MTLGEVLRTWDKSKRKRTWRYLGFLAYILSASGLPSAWAKLINWRAVSWQMVSRLPRGWKERRLRATNRACDAPVADIAVTDEKGNLKWHALHSHHINIAEELAPIKEGTNGANVRTDSKVAFEWLKRTRKNGVLSVIVSVLC